MHIPTHLPLLFLTLFTPLITSSPVAVSLEARDASAVKTDLSKIATDLDALTGAVKDFSGGLSAALKIQSKEQAVEKGIDKAISDTNAAKEFSKSESSDITKALLGLEPNIKSSLGALVEKVGPFSLLFSSPFLLFRLHGAVVVDQLMCVSA